MAHHLDRPIASPFSQLVVQRVKEDRQAQLGLRDGAYARLQIVTGYNVRRFVADVEPSDHDGAHPDAIYRDSGLDVR